MLTFSYDAIDSTSDQAKRLVAQHPRQVMLVSADRQTAGRGRSGRMWQSPVGGAWFSVAWPTQAEIQDYDTVPLLAGKAVLDTVGDIVAPAARVRIKWPNDVLVDGKKVAGVLCERVLGDRPEAQEVPAMLIVGVGINANFNRDQLGDGLRWPADTLSQITGARVVVPDLIRSCAAKITQIITRLERGGIGAAFFEQLESDLAWMGQGVSLRVGDRVVTGLCVGLDGVGRLRLEVDGREKVFDAGEVSHVRAVGVTPRHRLVRQ